MLLKKLNDVAGFDTSNSAGKSDFIALKAELDKLNINELVNVPTGLSNSKTKVDDLDVGNLKTVPIDLKRLTDIVYRAIVKKLEFNKLNTKLNNLEKKTPETTTLTLIKECNTDKQSLEKKNEDAHKKYQMSMVE